MGVNEQTFLDAEKTAEELVNTLEKLKTEVLSYKAATNELGAVKVKLERFIDASVAVVADTHSIVQELRRIGGPELMERMSRIEKEVVGRSARLQTFLIVIGILVIVSNILTGIVAMR